jgi:hypothetical protein
MTARLLYVLLLGTRVHASCGDGPSQCNEGTKSVPVSDSIFGGSCPNGLPPGPSPHTCEVCDQCHSFYPKCPCCSPTRPSPTGCLDCFAYPPANAPAGSTDTPYLPLCTSNPSSVKYDCNTTTEICTAYQDQFQHAYATYADCKSKCKTSCTSAHDCNAAAGDGCPDCKPVNGACSCADVASPARAAKHQCSQRGKTAVLRPWRL